MFTKMQYLLSEEDSAAPGPGDGDSTEPTDTPAPDTDQPVEEITTRQGKTIPMARTTIDKLKRQHLEKGRKSAQDEIEKRAMDMGFATSEEMFEAFKKQKAAQANREKSQAAKPVAMSQQNGNGKKNENTKPNRSEQSGDRRQQELTVRLERERKERIKAQRKAEQAQQETWAAEAHGELKIMAMKAGIKDPDYGVELWTRECTSKRDRLEQAEYDKWLNETNEQDYFVGLGKTHPHLFQETIVPATTGTEKTGSAPPPPGAGQVIQANANAARTNVRGMSREDYQQEVKRRGLKMPSL